MTIRPWKKPAADKVKKIDPKIKLSALAYSRYYLPPDMAEFKLESNVEVEICRTNLTEPTELFDGKNYRREDFEAWSRLIKGDYYTWEYFLFPQYMKHNVFPSIVPHRIAKELKRLIASGNYQGSFIQLGERDTKGKFANPVMQFFNLYVAMRVLDDSSFSVNKELDRFYKTFFGPAAAPMKSIFSTMENIYLRQGKYKNIPALKGGMDARYSWETLCPPQRLAAITAKVEKAKKLVADKSPYQERVELFDKAVFEQMRVSTKRFQQASSSTDSQAICRQVPDGALKDDILNSPLWGTSLPIRNFFGKTGVLSKDVKTVVRVLADNSALYVRFSCQSKLGKGFKAEKRNREDIGIFNDDSTEVFVDTGDITGYYHFAANALGSVYDAVRKDSTWNSEMTVATKTSGDTMIIVYKLPFSKKTLFLPNGKKRIRINFCRSRGDLKFGDKDKFISWQPNGFHDPNKFAELKIVKNINLLPNSGFEFTKFLKIFGTRDAGWRVLDAPYTANKKCAVIDDKVKHSGQQSLKVTDSVIIVSSPLKIAPSTEYEYSIWIKSESKKTISVNMFCDPCRGKKYSYNQPGLNAGGPPLI